MEVRHLAELLQSIIDAPAAPGAFAPFPAQSLSHKTGRGCWLSNVPCKRTCVLGRGVSRTHGKSRGRARHEA
eukprot:9294395-Alexandrium_andersonii.AAC.1